MVQWKCEKACFVAIMKFFVDLASPSCPHEISRMPAWHHSGIFLKAKNKMAAINNGKFYYFTHIFAYIVLRGTIFVSKSRFLASKNLFMMWYISIGTITNQIKRMFLTIFLHYFHMQYCHAFHFIFEIGY